MGAFQNQGLQSGRSYTQDEILKVLDKSVFYDIYTKCGFEFDRNVGE